MTTILSIIILNYNTKNIALDSIRSIEKNYPKETVLGEYELIIADNGSPDDSIAAFQEYKKKTKIKSFVICDNKENLGFAKGNNKAIKHARGKYVLILNPDTLIPPSTLSRMVNFMNTHIEAGAATCRIIYDDGSLDRNCLRGFPTPWNSFCHFSGLGKLFPKIPIFAGYMQSGWRDIGKLQEIEAIEGAFMLVAKKVGDKIGWLDEDYFFYGEDLQFCLDLHKAGYKIYYVPDVFVTHIGGASSGIKKKSQAATTASVETKREVQAHRFNAMRIFYKKNYAQRYPKILNWLIYKSVDFMYKQNLRN